jgi:outer membrane protein TolC
MEREVDMALAMLNTLLNAEVDTPRPLGEMPALPEMNVSLKQLQDDARQYCCILMATLWREIASDLARKAAKLEQRPIVALRAEARQMRGNDSIDAYDTGITMSFPWLWGGKYEGVRAGAEAEYAMASAELQEEIAMTLADIQEMYTEAEMRLRNVRLYEDSVLPQTRALAESSREAYPAGMIPAMEMLDAQNMLLEAEMNYQKERAAYATAHAKLMAIAQPWTADEVATGLPLHGGEEQ